MRFSPSARWRRSRTFPKTRRFIRSGGGRNRGRHHGRRDRDGSGECRHPGPDQGRGASGARPRHGDHPQELRAIGQKRTAHGSRGGRAHRQDLAQLGWEGFDQADIIIEAVFESLALKKQVFAEIDKIAKPECVLASNTSTLDIDAIAAVTSRPQMVIGTHFFSPANVMRLVEIVRGKATEKPVIATAHGAGEDAQEGRRGGAERIRIRRQPHGVPVHGAKRSFWWRKARRPSRWIAR